MRKKKTQQELNARITSLETSLKEKEEQYSELWKHFEGENVRFTITKAEKEHLLKEKDNILKEKREIFTEFSPCSRTLERKSNKS